MFPVINWSLISLELLATLSLLTLVVTEICLPKEPKNDLLGNISIGALLGMLLFWFTQQQLVGVTFGGMFIMDSLAWFFKAFFLIAMIFVFVMTQQSFKLMGKRRNEFYLLLWLALIGMFFIAFLRN